MTSQNTIINFLKINTENNSELIEDLDLEQLDLLSSISPFETANIDGMLLKSFKSILHIPTYQDLLKCNLDQAKSLSKLLNSDKNSAISNINRLLSINFREQFIFSKLNLSIICHILIFVFGELKRYKIPTYAEFEAKIKAIDFSKYNFDQAYLKKEYLENRSQTSKIKRENRITPETLSKISVKEIEDDWTEIDSNNINYENKYYKKEKGISYIDNDYENYIHSSLLTKDYNYDEEQTYNKMLTIKCFNFTKSNKDDSELPIELIILLYKLKEIKTLIFQIKEPNENFIKMAIFILMNIKWLFLNQIKEIKFDLNDEELQKLLYMEFDKRAFELYKENNLTKNLSYFSNYSSRKNNFWTTEGDIIFQKVSFDKISDFIFNYQADLKNNTFDETLCNIYNEYGLITNFKYIRPITYTFNDINKKNEIICEQNEEIEEDNLTMSYYHNDSISVFNKNERKIGGCFTINNAVRNSNPNILFNSKREVSSEKSTTDVMKNFVKSNNDHFKLMSLYFYFLPGFQNLKKFNIFFDFSHSLELQYMFSLSNAIYDRFHFLIFANNISSLTEATFSFNSLDSNSFENILGIIKKNKNLISLKMSLFSQEVLYNENNLLYLWSEKKTGLGKLFKEHNEFLIKNNCDSERDLAYFILHHNKIIDNYTTNMKNLFNLLKFESLNNLEEIIFRFDIPIKILNSERYQYIIVKFILNILIMLSFQNNKIKTFKILAPILPFDALKMPLIQQLFKEMKEEEKIDNNTEEKINKGVTMKDKINKLQTNINKKIKSVETNLSNNKIRRAKEIHVKEIIIKNRTLEEFTLNLQFFNLPEIFNIIQINNLENLKKINIGSFDEITFKSFVDDYKKNSNNLKSLISLKISLCPSVLSYHNLDKYILEYINIDSPNLEEKYLFSNLKIDSEEKMNELIDNVYYIAKIPKLIVQIGNDNDNKQLLCKMNRKLLEDREGMYSLTMIMDLPKYEKLRVPNILNRLAGFYCKKENRIIICNENPNEDQ